MKTRTYVTLLSLILMAQFAIAQLPKPIRNYPLNNLDYRDVANRKDGSLKRGSAYSYPDRFDVPGGAIELAPNAYISTPGFFEGSSVENGYTISFWTFIGEKLTKYPGVYPWEDKDKVYRAFFSYNNKDNCTLFGFYRRRDRAVVDRYTINVKEDKFKNWGIWYWDPVDFTDCIGWYQVFLVCKNNMTYLYMFYPDSRMEYALFYMGYQPLEIASNWGLGSYQDNSIRYLDDFKVYNVPLSKEQIIELHAVESLPDGMNEMHYAYNLNKLVQTDGKKIAAGLNFEMADKTPNRELTYQYVFEPVDNKPNVFRIRMAYTRLYMGMKSANEPVVLLQGDYGQGRLLEWYIAPTGDGYYFIRANINRDRYLESFNRGILQASPYASERAPYYKWRFKPLKSAHELAQNYFEPKRNYQLIDSYNTIMELLPNRPVVGDATGLNATRDPYPSLMSHYSFAKNIDDSYTIQNASLTGLYMYPADLNLPNWSGVNIHKRGGSEDEQRYFQFIVEKPNPLGRRLVFKPIMAQTMSVYSGNFPTSNKVTFTYDKDVERTAGREWQAFYDGSNPNANRQIATLSPGTYVIRPIADQRYCMHPADYTFMPGTKIDLERFDPSDPTISYWIVEYEKDNNNQPVRDGSYLIRKFATQDRFMAPYKINIEEGAQIYMENLDRSKIPFYKWFLEPTRDGSGSFYIENGADRLKFLESATAPIKDHSIIKFQYHRPSQEPSTYKWVFEKVSMAAKIETGVYNILYAENPAIAVHASDLSDTNGMVDVVNNSGGFQATKFEWRIIQNPDSSYYIQMNNSDLYLHAKTNSSEAYNNVALGKFDPEAIWAYKWQITSSPDQPDVYEISLYDDTYYGYIQIAQGKGHENTSLITGPYVPDDYMNYKFYIRVVK